MSSFCDVCSASPERIKMPFSAPLPMPTVSDVGVARPSAHGQAMMSVVTRTIIAKTSRGSGPTKYQTTNESTARIMTVGTK